MYRKKIIKSVAMALAAVMTMTSVSVPVLANDNIQEIVEEVVVENVDDSVAEEVIMEDIAENVVISESVVDEAVIESIDEMTIDSSVAESFDDDLDIASSEEVEIASFKDAETIDLGEVISYSANGGEVREVYYVFKTEGAGIYSINFVADTSSCYIQLYDSKYQEIYYAQASSPKGCNKNFKLKRNSKYYIKASATWSDSSYTLKVIKGDRKKNVINAGTSGSSCSCPIPYSLGSSVTVSHTADNQYKVYAFNTNSDSYYTFDISSAKDWVYIYDSNYTNLLTEKDAFKKDIKLKGNSLYYIVFNVPWSDSSAEFIITEKPSVPGKVTISSLKAGKEKFTVSYKKPKNGAHTYEIAYKMSGDTEWETETVDAPTLKAAIYGLESKKTYQVKVRGVKTVNGVDYTGPWSSVKKVKVK